MMRAASGWSTVIRAVAIVGAAACAAPKAGDVVVYASGADLESADPLVTIHPLATQVQRYALFVTACRYNRHFDVEPYFARAWRWSADWRVLSLRLTPGLLWQDGAPTTARDLLFTLDAARDPATGYPRASELASLKSARALDDTTVELSFTEAQRYIPHVICELPIVPEHVLRNVPRSSLRGAPFGMAPVTNGPFLFVGHSPGERWVLARNPRFPQLLGGPPRISRLVITVVKEGATKFAGLVSGDLDVAGISPAMVPLAAKDPTLRVIEYPVLQSTVIAFNVHRSPFDDPRVRRAIGLALDRRRIVDAALLGHAIPASGAIPPDLPFGSDVVPVRDTVNADSLLDAAGWPRGADGVRARGGRPLTFELLTVGGAQSAAEQLVQSDLAGIGVRVEVRQRELAAFLAAARAPAKTFDALFTGIPGDLSLAYLSAMFDSHSAGSALDYSGYHTPRLDSLLAAARDATDPFERARWAAVERELAEEAPVVWIYHARGVQALSRRLCNVSMDLRGELVSLTDWGTDETSCQVALR
ncbi:MAG TPA: peptide ABC transporter substrate-binding protein [Gemmatimonadaceae bacterium]|nr:peptide ABC transporter substrate-binding protein [Gemmatimonadaceae bacterium]